MRSWLAALAAAILLTACEAGPTIIPPTIEYRTATPTATPPRRMVLSAAHDGVRPTDTPTVTPTPIPPSRTPVPYVAPAPRPQPAVSAASYSGDWSGLICSYSWPCGTALAIMWCESSGNPAARNGRYLGLFQVGDFHFGTYGYDLALWSDPATNVAIAYRLWRDSGWGPWECKG